MSTTSIIALSVFVSLFVILLLGAAVAIVWLHLLLRRQVTVLEKLLSSHAAALQLLSTEIRSTLESHKAQTDAQIQRINGQALQDAVQRFLEGLGHYSRQATRIERAAVAFGELSKAMLSEEYFSDAAIKRAQAAGLGAEDYAPQGDGQPYITRTPTALGDESARAEEARDNTADELGP